MVRTLDPLLPTLIGIIVLLSLGQIGLLIHAVWKLGRLDAKVDAHGARIDTLEQRR